jgi:dUTP pyrophosphatase
MKINIMLCHPLAQVPVYETEGAAAFDLIACIDEDIWMHPGERRTISTGLKVEIPAGYEIQVRPRSGHAHKRGITVLNSPGTIDSDYRGVIGVILQATSDSFQITPGMRIAQAAICPVVRGEFTVAESLSDSVRGTAGYGSTGA